jgi:hypothetical protein
MHNLGVPPKLKSRIKEELCSHGTGLEERSQESRVMLRHLHDIQITMYSIQCLCLTHVSMTIPSMNGKLLGKIAQDSSGTIIGVPKV